MNYYFRYEDNFKIDGAKLDDASRVRLLIRKLNTEAHTKYINYILPINPRDLKLEETVEILKKIFGMKQSLFNVRYNCLKNIKNKHDDYVTYAGTINHDCES